MKNKVFIVISVLLFIGFVFCSCESPFVSAENLIHPPKMTGLEGKLQTCFEASVKDKGKIVLKSPVDGEYRSAYTLFDLDSDGISEAIVFYSVSDENLIFYMNILKYQNGNWKSINDIACDGNDIYSIEFSDLNSDNKLEIIVCCSLLDSKSNRILSVYSYDENSYILINSDYYTDFYITDIDNDLTDEIVICYLNSTADDYTSEISFLKMTDKLTMTESAKTDLYSENSGFMSILSDKRDNITYLYIDEIVGNSSVTEIVYFDNNSNKLVKPVEFDITTFNKCPTVRNLSVSCRDINNDGFIEIPKTEILPNSYLINGNVKEQLNIIKWLSFNNGVFEDKVQYIKNSDDGYILNFSTELLSELNITFDLSSHIGYFYCCDNNELLFTIKSVIISDENYSENGLFIKNGSTYKYYCNFYKNAEKYGFNYDVIFTSLKTSENI